MHLTCVACTAFKPLVHSRSVLQSIGRCNTCCDDHHFYRLQTKLRRLCFYTCLSFCSRGVLPQCMLGYTSRSRPPPQKETPSSRNPPFPRSSPPQADPLPLRSPPEADPLSKRLLLRTVRILLECILVDKHVYNFHCSFGEFYVIIRDFPKWKRTSIEFRESDKLTEAFAEFSENI